MPAVTVSKMKNSDKLYLCSWYFKAGFLLLPFLWLVNALWFYSEAFRRPGYPEQKKIKVYVILSGVGTLLWTIGMIAWITIYQINRASWGELGDNLSFLSPKGIP